MGRWWIVDPALEFASGYNYVGNNPLLYIDPDGAKSQNCCMTNWGLDYGYVMRENGPEGVKQLQQIRNIEAAGTTLGIAAWVAPLAVKYFGWKAVASFLGQEVAETSFEAVTGIPILIDPTDFVQLTYKRTGKTVIGHLEDEYWKFAAKKMRAYFTLTIGMSWWSKV